MPLVRVKVRNEYGLGQPELYREANKEDPKAVLDGVAVSGLVGILRQLGDLAEFAAEVFHGLQEQVMFTSSRSHKLMVRVQRIEAALPPLEKAILAQKSHLHFAYTAGSIWHAHLQNEQNHFSYSDLPQFIMDSYEECRDPPRLHLLDKFDTGGPGSCLKRYSDPTYFRSTSAGSGVANINKVSKERKARRSKKKRTWRTHEVSHGASISNHSDRTQFASLKNDGQISPPQTISTFDFTLKSDLGDQSNSFDSRTGSGYIECVFHPTYSVKPVEQEPKESSFSSLRMHQNDAIDSASVDENSEVTVNDCPRSLSQEQARPSSSCVTWDEKTEIVEPVNRQYDHDETGVILTTEDDRDTQENGAVNFKSVDQMDLLFDNQGTPTSISGRNQLDDIESEPDNYVDALNTIESESETDLDCQTKQKVDRSSNFNDEGTQDESRRLTEHHSDLQPVNLECCTAAYNSSNIITSFDKPNLFSSQCCANGESPQMEIESYVGMDSSGNDDILDDANIETAVSNLPYSGSVETNPKGPMGDKIISTSCESQKLPTEPSGVQSVKFWTNGGLLGLEPSKPPDFGVVNAVNQDSLTSTTNDKVSPSSQSNVITDDGDAGKIEMLVHNSKNIEHNSSTLSTSCHTDQNGVSDKKTSWRFLPTNVVAQHEKYGGSHPSNRFNDDLEHSLSVTSAMVPETEHAVTSDAKTISTEVSQRDGENESQISRLSNRFLVNGFQRKVSLVRDEKSAPPSSIKTGVIEQKRSSQSVEYQTNSEGNFKGYFGSGSPVNSPPSPPLQHMKISFQPTSGFETSKLKLKFPDGSYRHDSSRDVLPSFQLVPEPTTPQHEIGSDFDDDSFCRSSAYMSDDCLSHHSDSNSDQWESDDAPPSKDNELYDALQGISPAESFSCSVELDRTGNESFCVDNGLRSPYIETCMEPSQSGHSFDLPSLSTLNPLFEQEIKKASDAKHLPELYLLEEPTQLPPPLPPLQWRLAKSHSDVTIGDVAEALDHPFNMKILGSTISPQSKPSPVKHQQKSIEVIAFSPKSKQPDWQKLNGQKEVNQATNGRGIDEKEDFLHQIRTKSFSLRRTVTEKPTITPVPTANIKVTAILEKANAIRQAVGSDDGEDDNWSDT